MEPRPPEEEQPEREPQAGAPPVEPRPGDVEPPTHPTLPPRPGLPGEPSHPTRPPAPSGEPPRMQPPVMVPVAGTPAAAARAGTVVVAGVSYTPAGLWWRVGAFLIDAVVLMIAHQIMLAVIGFPMPDLAEMLELAERLLSESMLSGGFGAGMDQELAEFQRLTAFAGWTNVAMCCAYFTIFHGMLGATLGKLSLGLKVLRRDGQPLGYGWAFVRYLGYFVVTKLVYTAWLIPFNREQRTLYDMVLSTNVFRAQPARPQAG